MVSTEHEFPLDMIRHTPELAVQLLAQAGHPAPVFTRVRTEAAEATESAPVELRADSIVLLEDATGDDGAAAPMLAIVVECQQGRDARKRYTWPAYVACVRARLECPVILLVLTPTRELARWSATSIDLGGGYLRHSPLTMALEALNPITDADRARAAPELAILAAVHRSDDHAALDALVPAMNALDQDVSNLYADYVFAALPAAAKRYLEEQMTVTDHGYKSEFVNRILDEGRTEGRTEGLAESVLLVLDGRGVTVSDDVRARVTACTDSDELAGWLRRAGVVERVDQLFD